MAWDLVWIIHLEKLKLSSAEAAEIIAVKKKVPSDNEANFIQDYHELCEAEDLPFYALEILRE